MDWMKDWNGFMKDWNGLDEGLEWIGWRTGMDWMKNWNGLDEELEWIGWRTGILNSKISK